VNQIRGPSGALLNIDRNLLVPHRRWRISKLFEAEDQVLKECASRFSLN
jgi:hypothetical protein